MRKILIAIVVIVIVCIFADGGRRLTFNYQDYVPDSAKAFYFDRWSYMSEKQRNKWLDSINATSDEAILIRGADSTYDTIIDHIRYRFVNDK